MAVALVAAAIVLSLGIGAPFEKDQETQSAQWIQAIVQRGQWLLPRDDYGGIDRKPPLYYWLSALAVKAGGARVDEVSARLVSLVAGVLLAVAVMRWSAAFVGEATGWLALAFVLGTYGFASRATLDLTDMLLSLLLFATWWCVYLLLEEGGSRAVSIAGGVLLGLAVLTKGPVAIVLIGLAGFIYLLLVRRSPLEVLSRGWPWLMIAVALAIGACWYVPAFIEGGARRGRRVSLREFRPLHAVGAGRDGRGVAAALVYRGPDVRWRAAAEPAGCGAGDRAVAARRG